MDIAPLLCLHEQARLCTPPDSDSREGFNEGCQSEMVPVLLSSLDVFFGGSRVCSPMSIIHIPDELKSLE